MTIIFCNTGGKVSWLIVHNTPTGLTKVYTIRQNMMMYSIISHTHFIQACSEGDQCKYITHYDAIEVKHWR